MLAGMQLDLFTPMKDGPMSAELLARALGVRPDKLSPLLYALVAAGLLTIEGDLFSNAPEANHFLVRGRPAYRGGTHEALSRRWNSVLKTAETIRTGIPQAKTVDYSTMSKDRLESYYRSGYAGIVAVARELLARYDFSSYRSLMDVGGGSGGLAITITEAYHHIQATVVDLPTVTPVTKGFVEEAGATARVKVVAANVLSGPLAGSFDVAVMSHFIQLLSSEQARRAISNVGQVIEPGGLIYIRGWVIDNSRISPLEIVGQNLSLLNTFAEGQAYTDQEHRNWLSEAGFEGFERFVLPDGNSIIRARKPA
jgi:SAM-dependent methyltransferase